MNAKSGWMVVVAEQNNKRRPFAFLLIHVHVYKEERCEVAVEKNIAHFDVKVAIQNLWYCNFRWKTVKNAKLLCFILRESMRIFSIHNIIKIIWSYFWGLPNNIKYYVYMYIAAKMWFHYYYILQISNFSILNKVQTSIIILPLFFFSIN